MHSAGVGGEYRAVVHAHRLRTGIGDRPKAAGGRCTIAINATEVTTKKKGSSRRSVACFGGSSAKRRAIWKTVRFGDLIATAKDSLPGASGKNQGGSGVDKGCSLCRVAGREPTKHRRDMCPYREGITDLSTSCAQTRPNPRLIDVSGACARSNRRRGECR